MRRAFFFAAAAGLIAILSSGGIRLYRQQAAERRVARWQADKASLAFPKVVEQTFDWEEGEITVEQFAKLIASKSGLTVDCDEKYETVQIPRGKFTLRAVLNITLLPHDLCFDVQEERITITTLDTSRDRTRLLTVVCPLPQPETAGMDEEGWADAIRMNVEPDTWERFGGRGYIEALPGALVIVQSAAAHRQIQPLLDTLSRWENDSFQPVSVSPDDSTAALKRIRAALDQPATVQCVEMPLAQVMQSLAKQHGIPIVFVNKCLVDAGANANAPVTKDLMDISLRSVLRLVLSDFDLTFIVRDDALLVTSHEDAEERLRVAGFRVHDLVAVPEFPTVPYAIDWDSLNDLITVSISPGSWQDWSGPSPQLGFGDRWLIFSQTEAVHEQVADLLVKLRRVLTPDVDPSYLALTPAERAEVRITAAVQQPIGIDFHEAPLKDVIGHFRKTLGIPVEINCKALADAGINPDAPITFASPNGRAVDQLRLVLKPLGLTFVIRNEVLQITSPEDAQAHLTTMVFDVRSITQTGVSPDRLGDVIENVISSGEWGRTGGPGTVSDFRGVLVVTHTPEVLEQVEWLLGALEKKRAPEASSKQPAIERIPTDPALEAMLLKAIEILDRPAPPIPLGLGGFE